MEKYVTTIQHNLRQSGQFLLNFGWVFVCFSDLGGFLTGTVGWESRRISRGYLELRDVTLRGMRLFL
jgi:hypothetical protein